MQNRPIVRLGQFLTEFHSCTPRVVYGKYGGYRVSESFLAHGM